RARPLPVCAGPMGLESGPVVRASLGQVGMELPRRRTATCVGAVLSGAGSGSVGFAGRHHGTEHAGSDPDVSGAAAVAGDRCTGWGDGECTAGGLRQPDADVGLLRVAARGLDREVDSNLGRRVSKRAAPSSVEVPLAASAAVAGI